MEFGLFMMPIHPPERDPIELTIFASINGRWTDGGESGVEDALGQWIDVSLTERWSLVADEESRPGV